MVVTYGGSEGYRIVSLIWRCLDFSSCSNEYIHILHFLFLNLSEMHVNVPRQSLSSLTAVDIAIAARPYLGKCKTINCQVRF